MEAYDFKELKFFGAWRMPGPVLTIDLILQVSLLAADER